jgi:hypothetical protein
MTVFVDSRAHGGPVDSRAGGGASHAGVSHTPGPKGEPGPKWSKEEIAEVVREVLKEVLVQEDYRGEPGPAGKDADHAHAAEIAKNSLKREFEESLKNLEFEIGAAKSALRWAVIEELRATGVIDAEGNAVLIPGPPGKDSTVAGAKGDSIIGPAGRDGRDAKIVIGDVAIGAEASVTAREENGVYVLDFVLPRAERGECGADSVVPGPAAKIQVGSVSIGETASVSVREENGTQVFDFVLQEGPRGLPGAAGLTKSDVVSIIQDMRRRGSL